MLTIKSIHEIHTHVAQKQKISTLWFPRGFDPGSTCPAFFCGPARIHWIWAQLWSTLSSKTSCKSPGLWAAYAVTWWHTWRLWLACPCAARISPFSAASCQLCTARFQFVMCHTIQLWCCSWSARLCKERTPVASLSSKSTSKSNMNEKASMLGLQREHVF